MIRKPRPIFITIALSLFAAVSGAAFGQRTGYSRDEFVRRRETLMNRVKDGMIIFFGEVSAPPGGHFLQDNDFFYFTGVGDAGAICLMVPATRRAVLFLPQKTDREKMVEGPNLLDDPASAGKTGFTDIFPVSYFDEYIARNAVRSGSTFHIRLSPRDGLDLARSETSIFFARGIRSPYNDRTSLDGFRISKLRERYPAFTLEDVAPLVDRMRMIKSAEEIAILRRNGRISAEGVKAAMKATRPGIFEYGIEAAAMGVVLGNGATGAAYAPIVGSGPNSCIWHYDENSRRVEEGDIVLMDFGACLDHMTMDITRTWPASGTFSDEQRKIYRTVLEVEKACIEAYRPGATSDDVRKHVAAVMKAKGIDPMGLDGGLGHFVGLGTHDVGPWDYVLEEGMVFAIEPALYFPDKNIGIRVEDTVLVTRDGCEVLTRDVPKEIEDIERLLARKDVP
jgi:Xaa-Pro aminopeptidase